MANAVLLLLVVPMLSLLPMSSLALTQDFCVANLLLPDTLSGYPCKPQLLVNADDFYFRRLAAPGPVIPPPPFGTALASASVIQFPGLNGLGISATRFNIHPGGVVPLVIHPEASELLLVLEGAMVADFISANANTVYIKTVSKGELFVFPQGLLNFQYNAGNTTVVGYFAYSNPKPGLQIVDWALFKNNLPTDVVNKTTFISFPEIRRLKALFGGSG